MDANIIIYRDGYVDLGKYGFSIVKLVDSPGNSLLRDHTVGDPFFDDDFRTKEWEYSFMLPRSASLHEELNTILLCCKALFLKHKKHPEYSVIRKAKFTKFATAMMRLMQTLQIDSTSKGWHNSTSAIIETVATTGVPIYTFSSQFISICSNMPRLKYLEADYRQRIDRFVSSVAPVDSKMKLRVRNTFIERMGGHFF